ncbi:hypothetical protein MRX96_002982 [Rhipicephalus microplus]
MAVVESECKYVLVDVGAEGRQSDGGVVKGSFFSRDLYKGSAKPDAVEKTPSASLLPGVKYCFAPSTCTPAMWTSWGDSFRKGVGVRWRHGVQNVPDNSFFTMAQTRARNYDVDADAARRLLAGYSSSMAGQVPWQWCLPGLTLKQPF